MMEKLALGMTLVSLIYVALFLAISYYNGLLEGWKWSSKSMVSSFWSLLKKRQPEDSSHDDLLNAASQ